MAVPIRFIALGDSISEGWCDPLARDGEPWFGWADRLAILLDRAAAARGRELEYANLAVRGRRTAAIAGEQTDQAARMRPDLVSLLAGGNDLLLPGTDPGRVADRIDAAVARLGSTGATVLLATGFDPILPGAARCLRGRFRRFADRIREIADDRDAVLLDLWGLPELRDPGAWAADRIHLTPTGHRAVAAAAARALGVDHTPPTDPPVADPATRHPDSTSLGDLEWLRRHAAPWVLRRIRGVSVGDGLDAKLPEPVIVRGWWHDGHPDATGRTPRLSHHGFLPRPARLDRLRDDRAGPLAR